VATCPSLPSLADVGTRRGENGTEYENAWEMYFDGASSKEGAGAGIWVRSPENTPTLHSFKLMFNCANNVAEYEALMLGLNILKEKKARKNYVYGDSELVIKQVNGLYQTKNPKMRA